ncbi:MAG: nitrite/sulfite reductase [Pseudomonadales bacterium]
MMMHRYNAFDRAFVKTRNQQYRDQVKRRLSGELTEDEFKPLRLMNGVYLQLHAYMLRVAIPYGTLSSRQLRTLADIADRFDKGYGHFTTRQNIQFNWPRLIDTPDILDALAEADMHAIQTSGNTIRNVTADHFAGAAIDEIEDPRPYAELIRQWSTDHPEFQFLPRKFKIAVTGSAVDRAVIRAHDIGLELLRRDGQLKVKVWVGGGLGRTPILGEVLHDGIPIEDMLPFLEAILAVYNLEGRRDNKYKARIKILVQALGVDAFREKVNAAFDQIRPTFSGADQALLETLKQDFAFKQNSDVDELPYHQRLLSDPSFRDWVEQNVAPHRLTGFAIVTVSLKKQGKTPGDATSTQMRGLADLAEGYSFDELRVSHEQNLVLPHVPLGNLPAIFDGLQQIDLHTANVGLISDLIACPGMDYCTLATARSIPVAQKIAQHFEALGLEATIGAMKLKISGCINACGHHHVGHIGILGLNKGGVESYQITLGGDASEHAQIGEKIGPGFGADEIVPAIARIVDQYLAERTHAHETFLETLGRVGTTVFQTAAYARGEVEVGNG